jgi:hypothetical protein
MRLLAELLMLPVTGPVRALRFIAEQIQAEMDAAVMDEGQLEAELITLSLRHDRGLISGEEYAAEEARLLAQLDAIRAYQLALMQEYQATYDRGDRNAVETVPEIMPEAGAIDTDGEGEPA